MLWRQVCGLSGPAGPRGGSCPCSRPLSPCPGQGACSNSVCLQLASSEHHRLGRPGPLQTDSRPHFTLGDLPLQPSGGHRCLLNPSLPRGDTPTPLPWCQRDPEAGEQVGAALTPWTQGTRVLSALMVAPCRSHPHRPADPLSFAPPASSSLGLLSLTHLLLRFLSS